MFAFSPDLAPSVSSQLTPKEYPTHQPRTTAPDEGNMNTSYQITSVPSIPFQCYISPDSFEAGEVFCSETWPEISLMPSRVKNSIRAMSMSFVPLKGEHWLFRITDISTELWCLSVGESLRLTHFHGHMVTLLSLTQYFCFFDLRFFFFLVFFLVHWHNLASLPHDATS